MRNRDRVVALLGVLAVAPLVVACAALGLAVFAAAVVVFRGALALRAWRVRPQQVRFPPLDGAQETLCLTAAQARKALRS